MEGRAPITHPIPEAEQPVDIPSRVAEELREITHPGGTGSDEGRATKWMDWMDHALVRQVLATDPLNFGRGRTAAKSAEVADKGELHSLQKSGINKDFGEFELNMVELATRGDQSSIDPTTRRLAQEKAARLERDSRRVREDSM
ncbi:hypothetical protein HOY82DRAFT_618510 [Tuber indicum]|nr:hypothetical protein HOY82DRAFT_618510 [Tuber indicum]